MKKRILWLHNHTSLRKFEVPLLIELGYEVYCPKIFKVGSGDGSATITYKYDKTLSIPQDVLDILNCTDFYENITRESMEIVNQYFDIVMMHYFPDQLRTIVRNFRGIIVFQSFGLLLETPYSTMIEQDLGISMLEQIKELGHRFFFAQAYPHLKNIECAFFQRRAIDMPLGLPSRKGRTWSGGDERFLFVLPRINTAGYFKKAYLDFKEHFSGMKYTIAGAQPIAVAGDPNVRGFIPSEEYQYIMDHYCAMYYHSTEKNHIHYHPFEAIQRGMPVIFMAGGMIDLLGGKNLPGRCKTVSEAKRKLTALASGDQKLRDAILSTQDILLEHFDFENCRQKWILGMNQIESECNRINSSHKPKKIAVIMPQPYLGGVLDYTLRLIQCIFAGAREKHEQISVVFGYPDDEVFLEHNYFTRIEDISCVTMRSFQWHEKNASWVSDARTLLELPSNCALPGVILDDQMGYFEDCDYLIFTSDRIPGRLITTKPYVVVAHDYIQRYLPKMFGNSYEAAFIDAVRQSDFTFVTTEPTMKDAIQYAGLPKKQIKLAPLMFELMDNTPNRNEQVPFVKNEYFLWSTNLSEHKNHVAALAALAAYYHKGGTLQCVITGVNTKFLNWKRKASEFDVELNPYTQKLRKIILDDPDLKRNLVILGNLPKEYYREILQCAKFVFHPGYADNGNGTVIDAASVGVPSISSDYPAMRYIDQKISLHLHYFNPFDDRSITQALLEAEHDCDKYAGQVPERDELKNYTVDRTYREQYQIIKDAVEGFI